ncbi:hypothetical protein [Limibacillus halophilus]|jgi:hypothetical protein
MRRGLSPALLLPALLLLGACQTTMAGKAPTSSAAKSPPKASFDPAELQGQTAEGLSALLGEPSLVRREAEVEIWQYRGAACVLDLFLYPDGSRQRVIHLEARDNKLAEALPARSCLDQVLTAKATRKTA